MSDTVIKLEEISKQYRLGLVSSKTLRGDITSWYYRMRGKEDPTLKIGEENRLDNQQGEYVWSLRDINLEVKQGEILGIIGKNGAGKSTLLKLLSRVTAPTTGTIKAKGRIASLLEVGTGMHPELTGRENIYLNGAILGMTKEEIRQKFDEIVDFAGVAKYIDTPVKRYSSGMHVRLGFAVAAHLEPEILIVDEVLAVGDAGFQKKAIGKMQDISKGGDRTVLFVSHNMASVKKLCTRAILLENGRVNFNGDVFEAIQKYNDEEDILISNAILPNFMLNPQKKLQFLEISILDKKKEIKTDFERSEIILLSIKLKVNIEGIGYNPALEIWASDEICILSTKLFDLRLNDLKTYFWKRKEYSFNIEIPKNILKEGKYHIILTGSIPTIEILDIFPYKVFFYVKDMTSAVHIHGEGRNGIIFPEIKWNSNDLFDN